MDLLLDIGHKMLVVASAFLLPALLLVVVYGGRGRNK